MTKTEKDRLLARILVENQHARTDEYLMPVNLHLGMLLSLIASLQLALRHPRNEGMAATHAREFISAVIDRLRLDGYPATAQLAELGNDPQHDEV